MQFLILFAEAAEVPWGQVVSGISSLGSAGFTGWLAYHLITKWIPDMMSKFTTEIEKARADYKLDIAAQRTHDATQNELERNGCERRHQESMAREEERHRELLARIDSTHLIVRTIDHGVRNVQEAQQARSRLEETLRSASTKELKGLEETQK